MRTIEAGGRRACEAEQGADDAAIGAALGAMRMDDVRPQGLHLAIEAEKGGQV